MWNCILHFALFNALSSFLSCHASPFRMETFAARWISTAFRTTKALPPPPPRAVLFFSFHYGTATSPQPSDDPSPQTRKTDSRMHMCMPVCAQKKKICKHTLDRLGCRGCAFMLYLCRQTATECACVTQEETEARVALTTVAVLCLCLCVRIHPFTKRLETFLNVSNPKPETNSRTDAEGLRLSTFA